MNEKLIRLIKIIMLVQARARILARELAEAYETTERTIYRDSQTLSATGLPIINVGHGKGYEIIDRFSMYPLHCTEQEAMAF
ncbi:hypothetical protein GCM10010965_21520 [Caldalkalibacillus thermarum]|uniref:helix-turn-helix transcriptional regulator n=1 Tax=Caldalkalibacillus thermarum TaxID=296745 RepID=UPI00166D9FF5|nr:HTH domain-containing protein [Caldalkalibacillus thermarum]GGK28353.1 hypothetical protein GCM10010965_21520 [Caldalkalibacillus thermarum]